MFPHRSLNVVVHLCLVVALLLPGAVLLPQTARAATPTSPALRPSTAPDACSVPRTRTIRGKSVTLDQCYGRTFNHDGTAYSVDVYYTETNSAANLNQCTDDENAANRCEHALPNNDDGNGDNVEAVAMADEMETTLRFYHDRGLNFLPAGNTTMNVYIAEDPRTGGIINADGIYVDDDWIVGDQLAKRILAFHETQHMVQTQYDDLVGWRSFYGEGIARAIEDRVDPGLDADLGHLFINETNRILGNTTDTNDNGINDRDDDILTVSYRSVLFWTWLWDQYRQGGDVDPVIGWDAIFDFYQELSTESDQWKAVRDFITSKGGSLTNDFIDYSLALYAYRYNPGDPRLGFLDNEITNNSNALGGHTTINGGPAFATVNQSMQPRSARYWEFNPASQCDFVAFTFDGQGDQYGFSVMTVDGGSLQDRWTSYSSGWARTVRSADLDRVVGVVTALDNANSVQIGYGCVSPKIDIKSPTTAAFEMVGLADNPRKFIVRVDVDGEDGSGVAGLTADDFVVEIQKNGGGPQIEAQIINATYVQDDYWLLVQAPSDADGAESGAFYNLSVTLGAQSDSENSALLYVERTQDAVLVLDRSGSMGGTTGKIDAARNAANLLTNELSEDDQGGYIAFDDNAFLRESLAAMTPAHRTNMENKIAAETPGGATSIGDGMQLAAQEHDANGIADNLCSFVLLSDGHENTAAFWADVQANVIDNGCAIHTIALGPGTNELLLQQIAASVPGGSYDYATTSGDVPINTSSAAVSAASLDAAAATTPLSWQNNLSRIYDAKMTRIAGRQRIFSAVGGRDKVDPIAAGAQAAAKHTFYVDETTDTLVVSIAHRFPESVGAEMTELIDPDGNPVDTGFRRIAATRTNQVWEVPAPKEGFWTLNADSIFQEYHVSATALTDFELYLFIGTPVESLTQGVLVPIFGVLVGPKGPLTGANVVAHVEAPDGNVLSLTLFDDGNHRDSEPDDGIYANLYPVTSLADLVENNPDKVAEGEEPQVNGSYQVTVIATLDKITREAQDSFAIARGSDEDADAMPDDWERTHGLDPKNPDDATEDWDGDRLPNVCEYQNSTDPLNPDTDAGGESDGSEVPSMVGEFNVCYPTVAETRDPLQPRDDRGGRITVVQVVPEVTLKGVPFIHVFWNQPDNGRLQSVDLWRRCAEEGKPLGPWQLLVEKLAGHEYEDFDVVDGLRCAYRLIPLIDTDGGAGLGRIVESAVAKAKEDPYAPSGSVLINDGTPITNERLVKLSLAAEDSGDAHDGGPDESEAPGTPLGELEMRISNSPDFSDAPWQPFRPIVTDWDLGEVKDGDLVNVFVQFRDAAGNIGDGGFAQEDSIRFEEREPEPEETSVYLPIVTR